jgi:tRNA-specific 2-thiouridylase
MTPKKFIMVGISGGVDSAVAAKLLCDEGHHVEALFMKNWEGDDTDTHCNASEDITDAEQVCEQLNIKLNFVNFSEEYWDNVFAHFLEEYKKGRTPNPDILCNREIKFNAFLEHAKHLGADLIATGHYAKIFLQDNKFQLARSEDQQKDQTYFLYTLTQKRLEQSCFPLGSLQKSEVRQIAQASGFTNYQKKDSTGICFIGERKFKTFLEQYLPATPGTIESEAGVTLGQHDGLMYYTIGQRKGLKIGGHKNTNELPWYVVKKDLSRNVLVVVQGHEHPLLFNSRLIAEDIHWIAGAPPNELSSLSAKIRYRTKDSPCSLTLLDDNTWQVDFTTPEWAITSGQSVVFYKEDICLGGATIK